MDQERQSRQAAELKEQVPVPLEEDQHDQRHAEILVKSLNLQGAKGVETPGVQISIDEALAARSDTNCLVGAEATAYRACAARGNFLGLDRPDVQYAAKEISRYMAKPQENDIAALKRLGRYVKQ